MKFQKGDKVKFNFKDGKEYKFGVIDKILQNLNNVFSPFLSDKALINPPEFVYNIKENETGNNCIREEDHIQYDI